MVNRRPTDPVGPDDPEQTPGHVHHHHHPGQETPVEVGHPAHPESTGEGLPAGPGGQTHSHAARPHAETTASGQSGGHAHDSHARQDKHAGHSVAMFRDKFWATLALTVPTLVWGHMLPQVFGYTPPPVPGARWIAPAFGTAVFLYGGLVFLQGAWRELRARLPGMMTLIALAITVAFVFSVAVTLGYPGMPLWEELATLVTIMLLGHWIEMRSISQAQGALQELAKLLPNAAERVRDGDVEEIPISALRTGDVVLVRPGASIPADGAVVEGATEVNESMITGESQPVRKAHGERVIAGTVNGAGSLRVQVTGTGEQTALAGIMRLVEQAQTSRSRAQALADRAAFWLTIAAIAAGAVTFVIWMAVRGDPAFAVERLVTVLVISCPHALGLAVPLVIAISTTLGAKGGLLVRDRRGLEEARNLTAVVFDKTGTLTRGEFGVVGITTSGHIDEQEALGLAAAVEQDSEHTIAQGIVRSAKERGIRVRGASDFQAIPGVGVRALVDGRALLMGGPALLRARAVPLPAPLAAATQRAAERGQAVIFLLQDTSDGSSPLPLAGFIVADVVRPESKAAVDELHAQRIKVVMLTGDARPVAQAVATELGIDTVFAEVLPQDKVGKVQELQRAGERVGMVGDGVNDAPALVSADVGVAIGAGTEVAVEAGDIVLVRSDPRDVPRIVRLSRASYRKMVQNLWWAAGYNVIAIPLAAGVLAKQGILLSPAVGAVLMSLSTVIVAVNAQLLRRSAI
jgi:P-type Cu2+ transporter